MIYFSTLQGKHILDVNGRFVGHLIDFTIAYDGKSIAQIDSFVTKINGERRKIPQHFVEKYDQQIHLSFPFSKIPIMMDDGTQLSLANNILDRQIVDTEGMKVVRVNDVILSVKEGVFCATSVDVGFKGFVRRLGFGDIDSMPVLHNFKEKIIPWDFVAPIEMDKAKLHLNIPKAKLSKLHPADIADIMEDLSHRERAMIFRTLDENLAAQTLKESNDAVRKSVFRGLKPAKIADILEELPADEAADIILKMPKLNASEILGLIDPLDAKDIKEILQYGAETAGGLMNTSYVAVSSKSTVDEVINYLRDTAPSSYNIYYIYVVGQDNVLEGVLSLRNLIIAKPNEVIENIMFRNVITVNVSAKKESIAGLISKYNLLALPVVNKKGQLEGIIRSDLILELVMPKGWRGKRPVKRRRNNSSQKTDIKRSKGSKTKRGGKR